MSYRSLLCIVRDGVTDFGHLEYAIGMARDFDAHLDVLCLGIDRVQRGFYYAGATVVAEPLTFHDTEVRARELKHDVDEILIASDIRWSSEAIVSQWGSVGKAVQQVVRYGDLLILPRPYGSERGIEDEAILEAALFEGPAPCLIVPPGWASEAWATEPIIATNQGAEAITAVRAGLPGLTTLGRANIAIVDPKRHGPEGSDPGGALSVLLARHGVRAEISVLTRNMPRISDVLMRHIHDRKGDLLVMGAYGQSRLRESVLGGPTRDMLAEAPVPVLMAH
ncbi:MAG: universal stress protein [Pseudomonadota bacterium]